MKKCIKSNFIQKSILIMLATILLVNLVIPIISYKIFAEGEDKNPIAQQYATTDGTGMKINGKWYVAIRDANDSSKVTMHPVTNEVRMQNVDNSTYTITWKWDGGQKVESFSDADMQAMQARGLGETWANRNKVDNGGYADGDGRVYNPNASTGTYSEVDVDDDSGVGGVLLDPFVDFFATIGDAVINLLQYGMYGEKQDGSKFSIHGGFLTTSPKQSEKVEYGPSTSLNVNGNELIKGFLGLGDKFYYPHVTYSPEQIFANRVPNLEANFINPTKGGVAGDLQTTIAEWYVGLRRLAVVGLLSVLVYVGIRILISTTASDKAKYKQLLTDWIIALCLLFFLHYIMSFTMTMVESIVEAIGGDGEGSVSVSGDGIESFNTNMLGAARFMVQHKNAGTKIAYLIMYLALVIYTVIFTFFYLKRMIMLGFLTMIAPLVALTYPIDKMNDGKAQAFDNWLKEFVYNALIQPFHLIIYMVFVGSALDFAMKNPI